MNHLLVTGGCGFIGSNFVRLMLATYPELRIVNLDSLTYAGNLENLTDLPDESRYTFVRGDIADRAVVDGVLDAHGPFDGIVNFAAESHVDRSILDASAFVRTNVMGTQTLLDAARAHNVGRFLQISTDEVYGSLGPEGTFTEATPLAPNSPYSASKAAADLLVRAYFHTHDMPVLITRCSNNYGPYQFPEKLIPLFIANASADKVLPLYGDGGNVRDWIHVEDHCRALDAVLRRGRPGEVYNIGGQCEKTNLAITHTILEALGKPESLIQFVTDRPGHDRRYAVDCRKLVGELGWEPQVDFASGITDTVRWYQDHADWVDHVTSGEYRQFYDRQYGDRLGEV